MRSQSATVRTFVWTPSNGLAEPSCVEAGDDSAKARSWAHGSLKAQPERQRLDILRSKIGIKLNFNYIDSI